MKQQILQRFDTECRQSLGNARSHAAQRRDGNSVGLLIVVHAAVGAIQVSSTIIPSISTSLPFGSAATPTAARAG